MNSAPTNRRDWIRNVSLMSFSAVAAACAKKPANPSTPSRPGGLRNTDLILPSLLPTHLKDTYTFVKVPGKYIALTYDDGPHGTLTPKLLDILKSRNVKATFFVIGRNTVTYPHIANRIIHEGHEIGNHTWSHPQLPSLSDEGVVSEIQRTDDAVFRATGVKPKLMRPPYGAINNRVKNILMSRFNYPSILWSCDPLDWKKPGAAAVAERLIAGASPGAILLAHDIHAGTIDATPRVLDTLLAQGYQFITTSQLIALGSPSALANNSHVPIYSPGVL